MTMRASLIITAKDQANGVFARIAAGARRMGNAFKPVQKEAHAADAAIGKVGNGASARFARIGASARKMAGDMRIGQRAAYGLGVAIGTTIRMSARLGDKMLRMAATTAKWGAIAGAGAVGFGIGKLLTGAISTGRRTLRPNNSDEQSTFCTLRSTRGLKAIWSSDCRFRASVVSVSVPPTM